MRIDHFHGFQPTYCLQTYSSSSSPDGLDDASGELAQIFSVNSEQTDAALRAFVSHACQLRNHKQLLKLLRILEAAVSDGASWADVIAYQYISISMYLDRMGPTEIHSPNEIARRESQRETGLRGSLGRALFSAR